MASEEMRLSTGLVELGGFGGTIPLPPAQVLQVVAHCPSLYAPPLPILGTGIFGHRSSWESLALPAPVTGGGSRDSELSQSQEAR